MPNVITFAANCDFNRNRDQERRKCLFLGGVNETRYVGRSIECFG
jgi:hypothetical protein